MTLNETVEQSLAALRGFGVDCVRVGLVLGSGFFAVAERLLDSPIPIAGESIPGLPRVGVEGHSNRLSFGTINGVSTLVFGGRKHLYEQVPISEIVYPILLLKALGAEGVVLTNASGAVNPEFQVGQLMLIRDHLETSFGAFADELEKVCRMGRDPSVVLVARRTTDGSRPILRILTPLNKGGRGDLSSSSLETRNLKLETFGRKSPLPPLLRGVKAYDPSWFSIAKRVGVERRLSLVEGVYCMNRGPFYETPAEVRACRHWGADALGMSTYIEAVAAHSLGLKVLGVSGLTNMATGLASEAHTHKDVRKEARNMASRLESLLKGFLEKKPLT